MRILAAAALSVLVIVLMGASDPYTLQAQVDEYLVEIVFIDGLPIADEPTRIAVTVVEPQNRTIPDDPAILYVSGGPQTYRLTLDRAPTTYVELPALDKGDYDMRVQVIGHGATEPLLLSIGTRPLFEANPLVGGLMVSLGVLLVALILLSDRFGKTR